MEKTLRDANCYQLVHNVFSEAKVKAVPLQARRAPGI